MNGNLPTWDHLIPFWSHWLRPAASWFHLTASCQIATSCPVLTAPLPLPDSSPDTIFHISIDHILPAPYPDLSLWAFDNGTQHPGCSLLWKATWNITYFLWWNLELSSSVPSEAICSLHVEQTFTMTFFSHIPPPEIVSFFQVKQPWILLSYLMWHHFQTLHSFSHLCRGVQPFGISGSHWKKKSCLGPHIKYTNTNKNWWAKKKVLSKFTILSWATFIAILGHMQPMGQWLDTPCTGLLLIGVLPQILNLLS